MLNPKTESLYYSFGNGIFKGNYYLEPFGLDTDSGVRLNTQIPYIYLYATTGDIGRLKVLHLNLDAIGVKIILSKSLLDKIAYFGFLYASNDVVNINSELIAINDLENNMCCVTFDIGESTSSWIYSILGADKDKNLLFLVGGTGTVGIASWDFILNKIKNKGYNIDLPEDFIKI